MKISVVVPVYGCRGALEELHERLTKSIPEITEDYEIILVNDNCPQNSLEVIKEICKKDKKTVGIELSRNFGQMKAILAVSRRKKPRFSWYGPMQRIVI